MTKTRMADNQTADGLLGRVLRHEVDVSSLLAYCAALDPAPLQRFLQLPDPIVDPQVEVQYGRGSRLDVVLNGAQGPQAVLEVKVSATAHGDQFTRYDAYAQETGARRFLVDLELPGTPCPEGWSRFKLADIFGCWEQSSNTTARTFAARIAHVFRTWTDQTRGTFLEMDPAILTVVTRSVATTLMAGGLETVAAATSAGQPALLAREPHPSGLEDAYLGVNVRCQDKTDSARTWLLRAGVHVDAGNDVAAARSTAHQLASAIEPALTLAALQAAFDSTRPDLALAISGDRPLKSPRNRDAAIERWLAAVSDSGLGRAPRHPIYHHDQGRRLAAQFSLDVGTLTGDGLAEVIRTTMAHLSHSASAEI